jgi:hypothetical protein
MRSSIILGLLAFAISQVSAQSYTDQSEPFYLVVTSQNATINGSALAPCHEGAAIEGLCPDGPLTSSSYTYNLNYSAQATADPVLGITGLLTWELQGAGFNVSEALQFEYSPTSNVVVPLFEPLESSQTFGFDAENKLFVPEYLDDTVVPPAYVTKPIYRWRICQTNAGYYYTTLAWVIGPHSAENPTCQKVNVVRVFA